MKFATQRYMRCENILRHRLYILELDMKLPNFPSSPKKPRTSLQVHQEKLKELMLVAKVQQQKMADCF